MAIRCGDCNWYTCSPVVPGIGKCLLFASIEPKKRDVSKLCTEAESECRYNLLEAEQENLKLEDIVKILNRIPEFLYAEISPRDISPWLICLSEKPNFPYAKKLFPLK